MKKIYPLIAILFALFLLVGAHKTQAAEISSGDTVSIEKTQKNPLVFSNISKIKSAILGDLTVLSGDAQVDGSVESSVYIISGKSIIKSPEIGNRLVVFSGETNISSHIKGDLIVLGGTVTLESPNIVDGDIFVYGGNVYVKGQINSSLKAGGGKVMIEDAIVQGDAKIWSDQISISDKSRVNGSMEYWAKKPNSFPAEVFKTDPKFNQVKSSKFGSSSTVVGSLLMLMFFTLLVVWIQKDKIEKELSSAYGKFGKILLIGLLVGFLVPLIIIALMISYVGVVAGLAILFSYITAWFFAYAYSTIFVGAVIVKWLTKSKNLRVDWSSAVIGSVVVALLGYAPVIGALILFVLSLFGMGAVYSFILQIAGNKK